MKKILLSVLSLLFLSASLNANGHTDVKGVNVISLKKADFLLRNGKALFLDARGQKLYLKGTIAGSMNLPVKKYEKLKKLLPSKDVQLVTFCNGYKCEKSDELAQLLVDDGYKNVSIYKGGFPEWKKEGYTAMGLLKECSNKPIDYKPTKKGILNGVELYLGQDKGMIDQFWFAKLINENKVPNNIQLVDVRKAEQFKEGHLSGAINISFDSKTQKIDSSKFPKNKVVVFYCNTGMQSIDSFVSLSEKEQSNVLYLDANVACSNGKCTVTPNENL